MAFQVCLSGFVFVLEQTSIDLQSKYVRFPNCRSQNRYAIAFSSHVRIHQKPFACVRTTELMEFFDQFIDI